MKTKNTIPVETALDIARRSGAFDGPKEVRRAALRWFAPAVGLSQKAAAPLFHK